MDFLALPRSWIQQRASCARMGQVGHLQPQGVHRIKKNKTWLRTMSTVGFPGASPGPATWEPHEREPGVRGSYRAVAKPVTKMLTDWRIRGPWHSFLALLYHSVLALWEPLVPQLKPHLGALGLLKHLFRSDKQLPCPLQPKTWSATVVFLKSLNKAGRFLYQLLAAKPANRPQKIHYSVHFHKKKKRKEKKKT